MKKYNNKEFPPISYIGNKKKLLTFIFKNIPIKSGVFVDLFAGCGSVSYEAKKRNFKVLSNDCLFSNFCVNKSLIENNTEKISINDFNVDFSKKPKSNLKFLSNVLYFPEEVIELEHIVDHINTFKNTNKYYLFLSLLRRAMIRKMPYARMNLEWDQIKKFRNEELNYKKYKRYRKYQNKGFYSLMKEEITSYNNALFSNKKNNRVFQMDAFAFVKKHLKNVDLVYIDPPYPNTMNDYKNFYWAFDKMFTKNIYFCDFTCKKNFYQLFLQLVKDVIKKTKYTVISINENIDNKMLNLLISDFSKEGKVTLKKQLHTYKIHTKNKICIHEILIIVESNKNK